MPDACFVITKALPLGSTRALLTAHASRLSLLKLRPNGSWCFTLSWHYLTRYAAAFTHYRSDLAPIWITFKQGVELAGLAAKGLP